MDKYIVVQGSNIPNTDGCNYLSSVDKNGLHFSHDVDDAIVFTDSKSSILFARGITAFHRVDVYRLTEEVVSHFEFIW